MVVSEAPRAEEPSLPEPRHEEIAIAEHKVEAPRAEAPSVDTKALLGGAGLVMIETDPTKSHGAPAEPEQSPRLGRPRRQRTQEQPAGELVQIETRK
jgi:hypothetical protein